MSVIDLGLVLCATGDGTGSYTDGVDATVACQNIPAGGATYVAGPAFQVGGSSGVSLQVHLELGNATTMTIKLQATRIVDDDRPGSAAGAADIATFSNFDESVAIEHTYVAADFTAGLLDDVLYTTNGALTGDVTMLVKSDGTNAATIVAVAAVA